MRFVASVVLVAFLLVQCASSDDSSNPPVDVVEMNNKKQQILEYVNSFDCSGSCNYIAFGSKPCGGPREYLLFPSTVNVSQLEEMVTEYNAMENQYNQENNVISDCSLVLPPSDIDCVNGDCIIIN